MEKYKELSLFPLNPENMGVGPSDQERFWERCFLQETESFCNRVSEFYERSRVLQKRIQPLLEARGSFDFDSSFREFISQTPLFNAREAESKVKALRALASNHEAQPTNSSAISRFMDWLRRERGT